jgi:hypothetical protein
MIAATHIALSAELSSSNDGASRTLALLQRSFQSPGALLATVLRPLATFGKCPAKSSWLVASFYCRRSFPPGSFAGFFQELKTHPDLLGTNRTAEHVCLEGFGLFFFQFAKDITLGKKQGDGVGMIHRTLA